MIPASRGDQLGEGNRKSCPLAYGRWAGSIFEHGALGLEPTPFPLFAAQGKGLSIRGYTLREVLSHPQLKAKAVPYVFHHVQAGNWSAPITLIFKVKGQYGNVILLPLTTRLTRKAGQLFE
jgi:hypothetical protein